MIDPLRVGFNARLLSHPSLRGWNRYAINLLAHLPAQGVRPVLFAPAPIHPDHLARWPVGSFEVVVAPPMRYLVWEQFWLPRQCRRERIDVLHSTFHFGLPIVAPCPMVLTLHDAIDAVDSARRAELSARLRPAALLASSMAWASRIRADHVIAVSNHAKGDLIRHLRIPAQRITVTYEAADPHFHEPIAQWQRSAVRLKYGLGRRYVFYVGGWERRKNVPFLLRGFATAGLDDVDLCLAGGTESQKAELLELAEALGIVDRLKLSGWVDDADLPALYAEALGFAYPSEYEGFGLQLCEAMACGCPVLAARATSLPEILGDGGDTFTLADPSELAESIRRLATDDGYRADSISRGRRRAALFSWDNCAAETAAVYRRLANARPARAPARLES